MKKIAALSLLLVVAFSLACGGGKKAGSLEAQYFVSQIEEAIENTGPFDIEARLVKSGDAYDIKVHLKRASRKDFDWNAYSPEEKFGYFMGVCAGAVGALAMDAPEELEFEDLLIGYDGEVWSLPVDFCTYIAAASLTGMMSEDELATRLFSELEKVK